MARISSRIPSLAIDCARVETVNIGISVLTCKDRDSGGESEEPLDDSGEPSGEPFPTIRCSPLITKLSFWGGVKLEKHL